MIAAHDSPYSVTESVRARSEGCERKTSNATGRGVVDMRGSMPKEKERTGAA